MKKVLLGLFLIILALNAKTQGLEKVIVEKYYVSDAADSAGSSGTLPIGSVTYRIYVDMLPGYKYTMAYGDPAHTLSLTTTTEFFNNTDYGALTPTFSSTNAKKNTVMLDSWLSVGGVCNGYNGVLKSEDDGTVTFVNSSNPKLLQNNDPKAGIPLTVQDGCIAGTTPVYVDLGISPAMQAIFGDGTANGNSFTLNNGTWVCLQSLFGPTASNRVLIAQITTDGVFSYALNIQIQNQATGAAEKYVATTVTGPLEFAGASYNLSGTLSPNGANPTVSITAPGDGAKLNIADKVPFTANAADADGTIAKVEYFRNNVKIGEASTSPYLFNWTSIAGGAVIKAVAYDYEGNSTTSSTINIEVGNILPTVSIISPAGGSKFITGDIVTINATAADTDGSVDKLEFFIDGVSIGTDNTSPYSIDWVATKDALLLTAVATDNQVGSTTSDAISISVADNQAPTVSITAPANNDQIHKGNAYLLTAAPADIDGTITKLEFFIDNVKIGEAVSAPWQYNWSGSSTLGNYSITAKAYDDRDASTISHAVSISVVEGNLLPSVSLNSPTANAFYKSGDAVGITADATDIDGSITQVEFFINDGSVGTKTSAPYATSFTGVAGTYSLYAIATDNVGAIRKSAIVYITVRNPPIISLSTPLANAEYKVGDGITITAIATTDAESRVDQVEFFVDGISIEVITTAPFTTSNYTGVLGFHSITAIATDNNGLKTTSSAVSINIIPTGIKVIRTSGSDFIIYPNPAKDLITLSFTASTQVKKAVITIMDMSGRIISNSNLEVASEAYQKEINISSLCKGQYIIKLSLDGMNSFQKLIKQ